MRPDYQMSQLDALESEAVHIMRVDLGDERHGDVRCAGLVHGVEPSHRKCVPCGKHIQNSERTASGLCRGEPVTRGRALLFLAREVKRFGMFLSVGH